MPDSQEDPSVLSPVVGPPFGAATGPKPAAWVAAWHKPVFIVFLVVFAFFAVTMALRISFPPEWQWLQGMLWLVASVTSLVSVARRLPGQNVATFATVIASISWLIHLLGDKTGIPFGPITYTENLGIRLLDSVPWTMPFIWIVVLVNGRGVARLIMRPWRKTTYYGLWVMGIAVVLAVVFDLALEPYATRSERFWMFTKSLRFGTWYTTPWVNFLGWAVTALGIMAFSTPWLINKQPVKQPTDYHPLVVWLLVIGFLTLSNALGGRWLAVGVTVGLNAVTTIFAVRGAKW
ncbi:MAG TPA: carotenoid biosynthesis protein [Verrucomicrobiae bacterium]|nr:carotenoid biosynthesis protein [Verrucomicrobiae bacterium]